MFGSRSEREKEWTAFEAEALPLMADVFRVANYLARDRDLEKPLKYCSAEQYFSF